MNRIIHTTEYITLTIFIGILDTEVVSLEARLKTRRGSELHHWIVRVRCFWLNELIY